ncbi:DNA-binding TFAR19-related protein [Halogranum gelatinilyticum]|uniref:DNA-binding protein SAMN04487949_3061 n=1 Tax=Halogranum gelatinilyticum TaxID=660521 RepID=A0A1G9XN93_9EURY|nr:DNA-binding protein [Halogranum gelatinilyticum]SDM98228.1 DNA-binding TFAR19-related protein [Halogranum gelatinilyticum]
MSGNPDDDRLEELRQKKMQELQDQAEQQQQQGGGEADEAARQQAEAQKDALLRKFLTDGARQRLNAVQMSKPDFAEQVEQQVLALAQSGRIQGQIDEEQMKSILKELKPDSKSFDIRRR